MTYTRDGERERRKAHLRRADLHARRAEFARMQVDVVEVKKRRTRRERTIIWSSEYGFTVDALELYGEEGRDKLRKAAGRSTYPVIRG